MTDDAADPGDDPGEATPTPDPDSDPEFEAWRRRLDGLADGCGCAEVWAATAEGRSEAGGDDAADRTRGE